MCTIIKTEKFAPKSAAAKVMAPEKTSQDLINIEGMQNDTIEQPRLGKSDAAKQIPDDKQISTDDEKEDVDKLGVVCKEVILTMNNVSKETGGNVMANDSHEASTRTNRMQKQHSEQTVSRVVNAFTDSEDAQEGKDEKASSASEQETKEENTSSEGTHHEKKDKTSTEGAPEAHVASKGAEEEVKQEITLSEDAQVVKGEKTSSEDAQDIKEVTSLLEKAQDVKKEKTSVVDAQDLKEEKALNGRMGATASNSSVATVQCENKKLTDKSPEIKETQISRVTRLSEEQRSIDEITDMLISRVKISQNKSLCETMGNLKIADKMIAEDEIIAKTDMKTDKVATKTEVLSRTDDITTKAELIPKGVGDRTVRPDEEKATEKETDVMLQRSPIGNIMFSPLSIQEISLPKSNLDYPTTFQFKTPTTTATAINIYPDTYKQSLQHVTSLEHSVSCNSEHALSNTDVNSYDLQNKKKTINSSEFREMVDQLGSVDGNDFETMIPSPYANMCSPPSSYTPMSPITPSYTPSITFSPAPYSPMSPPYSPASSVSQDSVAGKYADSYQYIPNIDVQSSNIDRMFPFSKEREVELNDAIEVISADLEHQIQHKSPQNNVFTGLEGMPASLASNKCELSASTVCTPAVSYPLTTVSYTLPSDGQQPNCLSADSSFRSAAMDTTILNIVPSKFSTAVPIPQRRRSSPKMPSAYVPIRPKPKPYTNHQKEVTTISSCAIATIKDVGCAHTTNACCEFSCVKHEVEISVQQQIKADRWVWPLTPDQMKHVNCDGDTLLHMCAMHNSACKVLALLNRYIRDKQLSTVINAVNKLKQTPLHLATVVNDSRSVRVLVSAGADPNVDACTHGPLGIQSASALHVAASQGDSCLACVIELLRSPAICITHTNTSGQTPLHCAVAVHGLTKTANQKVICSKQVIKQLILHGASLTEPDGTSGKTPLHQACEKCDVDLMSWLIDLLPAQSRSSALNQQKFDGNSCLHQAVSTRNGNTESKVALVKLLLKNGADPSKRNRENILPKNLANRNAQLINVLNVASMSASKSHTTKGRRTIDTPRM